MTVRPWLLLLALGTASVARADNTADEADVAFSLGNRAYAQRQYEDALREYFLSYRLVPNRNVLFNIARCFEALGRFNEAYRYYHDLSLQSLPPEDLREVRGALSRIRPKVALLQLETDPPGAEIFVDREDLGSHGKSPQTLALPPGRHLVELSLDGYRRAQLTVPLVRGSQAARAVKLERVMGTVELQGSPQGARIRESSAGPVLGTLPGQLSLPPGRHLLRVEADGFTPQQVLVEVAADLTTHAWVKLGVAPIASGKVVLTANYENALVKVDGHEAGFTPVVLTLAEGRHRIEVSLAELRPFSTDVQVVADQQQTVTAELRYAPPAVRAASKSLLQMDEAPASISVITADEIRAFGYTTLAQALAAVRGMFFVDDRQYQYVGVRGFWPPGDLNTRVLILWDGHAMNDVWAGQGYMGRDLSVDLDEVDRIEVVRGPGSALYGTGAFFAVINIVPRQSLRGGRHAEITGAVGALGSVRGHLTGAVEHGDRERLLVSASGYTASGAELTDLGSAGLVHGLDGEQALNATMQGQLGDFTVQGLINTRTKQVPTAPFSTVVGAPGTQTRDSRAFVELRYDHRFGQVPVSARAYYDGSRYAGQWIYPNQEPGAEAGAVKPAHDSGLADWIGVEARGEIPLFARNHLTVGAEAQVQLRVEQAVFGYGDGPPLQNRTRTVLSAYASDEWALHPRLFLSAGLRVDAYSDLSSVPLTPRVALIGKPYPGGLTKLVAGTAFRAPTSYELYYQDQGQTQLPAGTLRPETITTFELEHSHDLTDELRVTVSGYHNRIENLISLQTVAGAPTCSGGTVACVQYANTAGLVRAYGAEAELRWQPGRFAMVDLSYSYVHLVLPDAVANVGTSTPEHLVKGRVLVPLGGTGLRLAGQAVYESARGLGAVTGAENGEALLVDLGLSGELPHLRYFAGVQNLLDVRYALPASQDAITPTIPQYGRTFLLQLTATF